MYLALGFHAMDAAFAAAGDDLGAWGEFEFHQKILPHRSHSVMHTAAKPGSGDE